MTDHDEPSAATPHDNRDGATPESTTPSAGVDPDTSRPAPYWNGTRIAAAGAFVLAAVAIVGVQAWRQFETPRDPDFDQLISDAPDRSSYYAEHFDTGNLAVSVEDILPGGVRKDGIPAITDPHVVPVAEADFLPDHERVIGVTINGETRGYPLAVLNYHEIYNDTLGGVPIAVIYCPLCDSVSVVDRRLDGQTFEFGVSGLLLNSNVLLFDRQDEALWSQVAMEAISGPNAGKRLRHLDGWSLARFDDWRSAHPEATVASFETGHGRAYDRSPYASYFAGDQLMFPLTREDDRLANRTRVVGVRVGDQARAYPLERVASTSDGRLVDAFAGGEVVLEAADAREGLVRVVGTPDEAEVVHTFWFAWQAFHPRTDIFGGPMQPASPPVTQPVTTQPVTTQPG